MQNLPEHTKLGLDAVSIAGIISVWTGVLTNIFGLVAAIATAAWAVLRLWETSAVQNWWNARKAKKQ